MIERAALVALPVLAVALLAGAVIFMPGAQPATDTSVGSTEAPEPPEAVVDARPMAADLFSELDELGLEHTTSLTSDGAPVVELHPDTTSTGDLEVQYSEVALTYADVVERGNYDARTLTIIIGEAQVVVPEPTVRAYTNGEINREAYLETLEVTDVERTDA